MCNARHSHEARLCQARNRAWVRRPIVRCLRMVKLIQMTDKDDVQPCGPEQDQTSGPASTR